MEYITCSSSCILFPTVPPPLLPVTVEWGIFSSHPLSQFNHLPNQSCTRSCRHHPSTIICLEPVVGSLVKAILLAQLATGLLLQAAGGDVLPPLFVALPGSHGESRSTSHFHWLITQPDKDRLSLAFRLWKLGSNDLTSRLVLPGCQRLHFQKIQKHLNTPILV